MKKEFGVKVNEIDNTCKTMSYKEIQTLLRKTNKNGPDAESMFLSKDNLNQMAKGNKVLKDIFDLDYGAASEVSTVVNL
jgi:hypothetical protein